ncbi:helix-turn-helix transcriptional regulator [Actinokineospora xionganensis]|uniref:Helix-turn-helix transcriptional regulator n=1 Tax=Actinokineospora xionganensis TaxID=2684470 RepID=A0ABR7L902_9PSEU|nr:helix-turn-helix transcriptional regulator [Actinokineospora xionganensis]MBC6448792.1 helix-turn-helix transcriptional regulator [Actinokineospora xionganensis]
MPKRVRLARARKAVGLGQEALAQRLGVERSTVVRWETTTIEPQPWIRPHLATELGCTPDELAGMLRSFVEPTNPEPEQESHPLLAGLRRAMFGGAEMASIRALPSVDDVHRLYQQADYEATARVLPSLITTPQPSSSSAATYVVAAKLATEIGDSALACVAADRALRSAMESERPALVGVAQYQVGCALLKAGHRAAAEECAVVALEPLSDKKDRAALSARGALTLLLAVLAAREGASAVAGRRLIEAQVLAARLGVDANHGWTAFGPTNVAIHQLSVATALGDAPSAQRLGERIDTDRLPAVLRGRRSQVHIDLAQAAADHGSDAVAVLHLLEAERVAKQSVSRNAAARGVLVTLLGRERQGTTPGLRALARRAEVAR